MKLSLSLLKVHLIALVTFPTEKYFIFFSQQLHSSEFHCIDPPRNYMSDMEYWMLGEVNIDELKFPTW